MRTIEQRGKSVERVELIVPRVHHTRFSPRLDAEVRPPALLSVEVSEGEEVEWIWTHDADGHSMVSGYRVVPKWPRDLLRSEDRRHG